MKMRHNRREFLAEVGSGMLIAGLGSGAVSELGLSTAWAEDGDERLAFGPLEPLVGLMQGTPIDRLMGVLVDRLRSGTELRDLIATAALANARTFGGEDYVGFHTMMALAPAFHMARELPEDRRPLPVLKVLYRNTGRIQEVGGRKAEVLRPVRPASLPDDRAGGEALRDAVRTKQMQAAEETFAALARGEPADAFNDLLFAVQDNTEVHRVVLPYRAWDLLDLIGPAHAHTLLRQSVRYCVKSERDWKHTEESDRPRALLPKLLDQYRLLGRTPGGRPAAEDGRVDGLCRTIFEGTPEAAAEAVAAALAEGMAPADVGEAITLAANQLVLRDSGRTAREVQPNKPLGSVHGDSIGVHACDSANAWRNMARAGNHRNTMACLILGAYQVAYDRTARGGDFLQWQPHPISAEVETIRATEPEALLLEADEAIRANDQFRACALIHRYGELGHAPRPAFDLLLRHAVSEDGALHAEKFYRTASEEFASTRPAFRWRHLTALARVTASAYGRPAPGHAEACQRLQIS